MPRHSRLQLEVLSLFKQFLRTVGDKPGMADHIRNEFRKNASLQKSNTLIIDHLLRKGKRQLNEVQKSTVTGMKLMSAKEHKQ